MLTPRVKIFVCRVIVMVLFFGGLISFLLWLTLRPRVPRFQIDEFAVHGMSQPAGFVDSQITYKVTIRNLNRHSGIEYDSMFASVHYMDENLGSNWIMQPFYQAPENTTTVYEVVKGVSMNGRKYLWTERNNRWTEFSRDRRLGLVVFRLVITSNVRFRENSWGRKHHQMHAKCHVKVNSDGLLLPYPDARKCSVHLSK